MLAVIGDIHGDFYRLNALVQEIKMKHPEVTAIIQVGDFGYYRREFEKLQEMMFSLPVYWIDGNHEYFEGFTIFPDDKEKKKDFLPLPEYKAVTEVHPNLFYVPRGTVMELDGRKIAFMGGAASVDKKYRLRYRMHWSDLENITEEECQRLSNAGKVDIFITHCPPQSMIQNHFDPRVLVEMFDLPITWRDPNADVIEKLWSELGEPLLFAGHMHRTVREDKWRILNIYEIVYI